MTVDLERRPDTIETGRTWRDIPPSPPVHSVSSVDPDLPHPPAEAAVAQKGKARAAIAGIALISGLALGVWAPWQGSADAESAAQAPAETSPDTTPVGPQAGPDPRTTLPDEIVPPPAPDSQLPGSIIPEDFFQFDGLSSLEEFLAENFGEFPGFNELFPGRNELIEVTATPDGYQVESSSIESTLGSRSHEISLIGPAGNITVRAVRSSSVMLPSGQPHQIGEIDGVIMTGDETTVAWMPADDLLLTVAGSSGVDTALLDSVAVGIEVSP